MAKGPNINLNIRFEDIKLDKLYEDANKSETAVVSSKQSQINQSYNLETANIYEGKANSETEIMDMSATIDKSSKTNIDSNNISSTTADNSNNGISSSKIKEPNLGEQGKNSNYVNGQNDNINNKDMSNSTSKANINMTNQNNGTTINNSGTNSQNQNTYQNINTKMNDNEGQNSTNQNNKSMSNNSTSSASMNMNNNMSNNNSSSETKNMNINFEMENNSNNSISSNFSNDIANSIVEETNVNFFNNYEMDELIYYEENLPDDLKNKFFSLASETDRYFDNSKNYGVDQNATAKYIKIKFNNLDWLENIDDLESYLKNKVKSEETASKIILDLKEGKQIDTRYNSIIIEYIYEYCYKNENVDILDIIDNAISYEYDDFVIDKLLDILQEKGLSLDEAFRVLCSIDSVGCCSYASVVNSILIGYKYKPFEFENDFGYPSTTTLSNGVNMGSILLLLDLYIFCNSNQATDSQNCMFYFDESGKLHLNNLDTSQQEFLSGFGWQNTDLINKFLQSRKQNLKYNVESYSYSPNQIFSSLKNPTFISNQNGVLNVKQQIINFLCKSPNNSVQLGITKPKEGVFNKNNNCIRFYDETLNNIYTTTDTWNERTGHIVCITGVTDNYFIVSSWGKRLFIPIEDLINNQFDILYTSIEGIEKVDIQLDFDQSKAYG